MNFFEKIAAVAGILRMSGKKIVAVKIYVMEKDAEKVFQEYREMVPVANRAMPDSINTSNNFTITASNNFNGIYQTYSNILNSQMYSMQHGFPGQLNPDYEPDASHHVIISTDSDETPAEISETATRTAKYKNALASRELQAANERAMAAYESMQQQFARNMTDKERLNQQQWHPPEVTQLQRNQTFGSYTGSYTQPSSAGMTKAYPAQATQKTFGISDGLRKAMKAMRGKK